MGIGELRKIFERDNGIYVLDIPINLIRLDNKSLRKTIRKSELEELSSSIKAVGVLEPIYVKRLPNNEYKLIMGERRLRAAKMAGLNVIPAIVSNEQEQQYAIVKLIANLQRENLNYFEEAEAYDRLIRENNFTQERLANYIGKSQSTIANKIRLLKLSVPIKKMLLDYNMSERHARLLLRISGEQLRIKVLRKIHERNLSVREAEELISKIIVRMSDSNFSKKENCNIRKAIKDIRIFINTIKHAVELMKKSGIDAKAARIDRGEFIDFIIRIPKKVEN